MPFTRIALTSVWLVTLAVFAMSGSGTITRSGLLILVVVALLAPAIILTISPKVSSVRKN